MVNLMTILMIRLYMIHHRIDKVSLFHCSFARPDFFHKVKSDNHIFVSMNFKDFLQNRNKSRVFFPWSLLYKLTNTVLKNLCNSSTCYIVQTHHHNKLIRKFDK